MKQIVILLLLLAFMASGCAIAHKDSELQFEEELTLTFEGDGPPPPPNGEKLMATPIAIGAIVSFATKQGIKFIKKKMSDEEKKYVATYGKKTARTHFLSDSGWPLEKIVLTRNITQKEKKKKKGTSVVASSVTLTLKPGPPTGAFSFVLDEAWVKYAKCKINRTEGVKDEKTVYPTIDLLVKVAIKCFWLDSGGIPRTSMLGSLTIPIQQVPVTGKSDKKIVSDKEKTIHTWFPPFPKNYASSGQSDVAYVLTFTVTEFDDYKKAVAKHGAFIGDTSDAAGAFINELLELYKAEK